MACTCDRTCTCLDVVGAYSTQTCGKYIKNFRPNGVWGFKLSYISFLFWQLCLPNNDFLSLNIHWSKAIRLRDPTKSLHKCRFNDPS